MKLYIYEHCPFCARVAFVANALNLDLEYQVVDYADANTLIDLIGKKMVPVLEKDDGTVMAESLDIIALFIEQAGLDTTHQPSEAVLAFQQQAFPLVQGIGYPRYTRLGLKEYPTQASHEAWRAKKETPELNFERLLAETDHLVSQVNERLVSAQQLLEIEQGQSALSLVDQAVMFSLLRVFYAESSIEWPEDLQQWMEKNAAKEGATLLRA
ncbi:MULTISPECIES: glutaredoxin 2 [unclassified Vibrio]|uniref:Glutaredoxin 2 n=1 Tax=Vibrio sp. HB236076 TaxID=3232307 RepID=A0AB39HI36_9VIBR|nr:glutaredoxin 2 [Vibrio sp. HB161653]MDP5254677.1 glutaredoxin 2 [Vibrio sp. HB161653]